MYWNVLLLVSWAALIILPTATFWLVTRSARNLTEDTLWRVIPYGAGIVLAFLVLTVMAIQFSLLVQPFRNGFEVIILSILLAGAAAIPTALIGRHSNKRKAAIISIGGLTVLFLLSTWDMVPGYLYYRYLCAAHGGLTVYGAVGPIEGYMERGGMDGLSPHAAEEMLRRYGYQYVETEKRTLESPLLKQPERITKIRYSLDEHGKVRAHQVDAFASKYEFVRSERRELPLSLTVFEKFIVDTQNNNQVVAEDRRYRFGAGAVLSDIVTAYSICPSEGPNDRPSRDMLRDVLKPAR